MSFLEWIRFGSVISLLLYAISCIVSLLPTFEARHLRHVSLPLGVVNMLPIAMIVSIVIIPSEASIVTLVSTIVVVTRMLVAITIVVVIPMLVKDMSTTSLR